MAADARPADTAQDWFEVTRVNEMVTAVREPLHFQDVVSYSLRLGDDTVCIDSGMGVYRVPDVLEGAASGRLLLTHCHWDHTGGAGAFTDIRIADDPFETERLTRGWTGAEIGQFGPGAFPFGRRPSWLSEQTFAISGISAWRTFRDGDRIPIGDEELLAVITPGHTPGSACFFLERYGFLFTGDTLYPGPEYIHIHGSSYTDYFRSLNRLWDTLGSRIRVIFPGHNAPLAGVDLLRRHTEAASGRLPHRAVQHDPGGRFVEYVWEADGESPGFSFRLPPSFPGFA